jgi:putative tryptophan/tyrosine transport system substrate-binding protein
MANRTRVNILALRAQTPTIYNFREFVEAGGLMSYGPNFGDLFRRAADLVDNILRGAKPGDIPVEQPIRSRDQFDDGQGAWSDNFRVVPAAR